MTGNKEHAIRISISGFRRAIFVGRGIVKVLGNPSHVGLKVNKDMTSIILFATQPSDPMSFRVPLNFGIKNGCLFKITSKQFVRQLTAKNGFDDNKNYTIYGYFIAEKGVAIFNMADAFENCHNTQN